MGATVRELVAREVHLALRDMDVAAWNAAHPDHPKGPDGKWADVPGAGVVKAAAKMGQAALDAAPAHLVGDGLGTLHPDHKRGTIGWSSGDPGWSAEKSERHVAAMEGYRGSDFDGVNKSLRGLPFRAIHQDDADLGEEGFRRRIAEQIELLDEVMKHSRLTDDITVIRGTSTGRGIFGDALAGDLNGFEWTEGAYVSTTANPAIAEYFTISGLILNIHAPKGTGAMALSVMTRNGRDDEAEVLLERGLRMRVVSDTGPGVPRTLEVEVIP